VEEKELITKLQDGNMEAFNEAYHRYSAEMLAFAYTFLRDKDDAADTVQDCFALLLNKPGLWKSISDLRWYLMRMVQNQCLGVIRKRTAHQEKEEVFLYYHRSAARDIAMPEALVAFKQQEEEKRMEYLLGFLTHQRKTALQLVYEEDLTYQQAAVKMGISKQSVKTHLRYAKQILKSKLGFMISLLALSIFIS
jgi:RNA polymerase sigma-70 factor (ECF subfamily)